jgi:tetratricopeptide (TPR) repeat protein
MNNIGNLYLDSGDPFRALDYYNRSVSDQNVLSDKYRMIIRYTNMADAYKQLKDFSNAILFLDKAVKFAEETGDLTQLASGYLLMGELNAEKGNPGIGISYLKKAAALFHETGARAEEANALVSLAGVELSVNNTRDALQHAEEAEELARRTGALKTLYNASDCLSQIWEKAGDHQQSLAYMKRVLHFKDSLFSIEKSRAMEEIEAGFTRTRLENENQILAQNSELQEQALKTRNVAVIALALSLFLALALTWVLYKRHVETRASSLHEKELKESEIEKLSDNLSVKDRELTSKTLLINQKNGLLQKIIGELDILNHENENDVDRIKQLQRQLRQELSPNAWKEFEIQFNEVHPGFHNRLLEKFPQLTPNERRLCVFLRLDMNTREISSLTGQSLKSIEVARTRIRSKMELPHDHNLVNFIALL